MPQRSLPPRFLPPRLLPPRLLSWGVPHRECLWGLLLGLAWLPQVMGQQATLPASAWLHQATGRQPDLLLTFQSSDAVPLESVVQAVSDETGQRFIIAAGVRNRRVSSTWIRA